MRHTPLLAAVGAIACAVLPNSAFSQGLQPGDKAPPITLEALTNAPKGAEASWKAFEGKTVVVEFWGTWCGPCVAAIPHLNEVVEAVGGDDFRFLSVTYEGVDIVERFLKQRPMKSWIGHDTDQSMVKAFGVVGWPTSFVVRDGVVVARTTPWEISEESLAAYAAGRVDGPAPLLHVAPAQEIGELEFLVELRRIEPGAVIGYRSSDPGQLILHDRDLDAIIGALHPSGVRTVEFRGWEPPANTAYNFEFRGTEEQRDEAMAMLLARYALTVSQEVELVDGYHLVQASSGVTLKEGVGDEPSGAMWRREPDGVSISAASASTDVLIAFARSMFRTEVEDHTGFGDRTFFLEFKVIGAGDEARRDFERQTGLRLVPAKVNRPVLVVRPAHEKN